MTGAQYRAARNHVNEKMRGISGRGLLPRPDLVAPPNVSHTVTGASMVTLRKTLAMKRQYGE